MKRTFNIPTFQELFHQKEVVPNSTPVDRFQVALGRWSTIEESFNSRDKDQPVCKPRDIKSFKHEYHDYFYAVIDLDNSFRKNALLIFEGSELVSTIFNVNKFLIFCDIIVAMDFFGGKYFEVASLNIFNNQPKYRGLCHNFVEDSEYEVTISKDLNTITCLERSTGFFAEYDLTNRKNSNSKKILKPFYTLTTTPQETP